jgi:hypothetical protein
MLTRHDWQAEAAERQRLDMVVASGVQLPPASGVACRPQLLGEDL